MLSTHFSSFANIIGTLAVFYLLLLGTLYNSYPTLTVCFLSLLTVYVGINSYFINKLYIVKGRDENSNSAFLKASLLAHYNKININDSGFRILIGSKTTNFWAFRRTFTALFDNEYIALNLSVYGRGDMMYCLIALYNYYKCKALLKDIETTQESL